MRGRKVNVCIPDTISARAMQPCVSITLSPYVDADSTWVDTSCHSYHIIVNSKDIQQSMWYGMLSIFAITKFYTRCELMTTIENPGHVPYVSTSATKTYFLYIYQFLLYLFKILGACHMCQQALQIIFSLYLLIFYIYSKSLALAICVNKPNKKIMICASDASSVCRSVGIE